MAFDIYAVVLYVWLIVFAVPVTTGVASLKSHAKFWSPSPGGISGKTLNTAFIGIQPYAGFTEPVIEIFLTSTDIEADPAHPLVIAFTTILKLP